MMVNEADNDTQITSIFTLGLIRIMALVLMVILLRYNMQLPAALTLFILLVTEGSRWWSRAGRRNLQLELSLNPVRLFPGEKTKLTVKITNKKILPVFLSCSQSINQELEILGQEKAARDLPGDISWTGVLWGHSSFTTTRTLQARKRGYYRLPPILVYSRDAMGLYSHQVYLDSNNWLVVYPRLVPLPELELAPANLIGDRSVRRQILPDPIRVVGLRDYTPDMPARLINWQASAHHDQLLARILEPSSELMLCLAVDVEAFTRDADQKEAFEATLSLAASLACWADSQGVPCGLLANASQVEAPGPVNIPVTRGPGQTPLILESLARLELNPLLPLPQLLKPEYTHLPWGTTLIVLGNTSIEAPPGVRQVIFYHYGDKPVPLDPDQTGDNRLPDREGIGL
ncbi:MAG: DUF58 domain-containing protein [Clostridia bacterium]|nr:DUF58 domain-containing protein [Clostridia bacterium]